MRLNDWEPRLIAYLGFIKASVVEPGAHDCALFGGGAVEAMTGEDHAAAWRGKYKTFSAGLRALKKAGYADHIALVASLLPEISPAFAHKGDVAVVEGDGGIDALGIVQGEGVYVLTPKNGLGIVSRLKMRRAFRV